MTQAERAERLRALHHAEQPLLLPNIWDVAGARLLEGAGWPAVASTSAGIAHSLGYPDGERIPKGQMLKVIARIASAVDIPVSADMEAGYTTTADGMSQTALDLIAAGAVGLNLEDSEEDERRLIPVERAVEKIAAVRAAGDSAGVKLVINARCDAFFLHLPPGESSETPGADPVEEATRRARAYRAAGADCIFFPGVLDLAVLAKLIAASPGPINVLIGPGAPTVPELRAAGVKRVSLGSGPYHAALGLLRDIGNELRGEGTYGHLARYRIPFPQVNMLVGKR